MSSGIAMNRKIQRERAAAGGHPHDSRFEQGQGAPHQSQYARQEQNGTMPSKPPQFLRGTPVQKNWHLLNIHEKRLVRLEFWCQKMMADISTIAQRIDEMGGASDSPQVLGELMPRIAALEQETSLIKKAFYTTEKKNVTFAVNEKD